MNFIKKIVRALAGVSGTEADVEKARPIKREKYIQTTLAYFDSNPESTFSWDSVTKIIED